MPSFKTRRLLHLHHYLFYFSALSPPNDVLLSRFDDSNCHFDLYSPCFIEIFRVKIRPLTLRQICGPPTTCALTLQKGTQKSETS
uniref:Secreted protein n=1 Tax=Bursaphelenchus xylophilus TaxID=6326 RepID=A0A1I7RQM7_BURXY